MRPRDTSERVAEIAAKMNRALGPERRLAQALDLSDLLRKMAVAGLKMRHPEYSEVELARALTQQFYRDVVGSK